MQPPEHPLRGVPLVESPFFETLFADADAETRRVATALHTSGFAVIDFPDPAFDARVEAIKAALRDRYDWARWRDTDFARGGGLRVQDAWQSDANVRALAANPDLLALLARLYGRPARPFQTLNFPVGTQQALHSDALHFNSVPQRFMCGVWVALEDIAADAGPLEYVPGSHAWPICTNDLLEATAGQRSLDAAPAAWAALIALHGAQSQPFLARRGQALIWAANLLHGGARQTNPDRTRWSQVTHYYFEGCAYYTPFFSDPIAGRVDFRRPVDIATGAELANVVGGQNIDDGFLEWASARSRLARQDGGTLTADGPEAELVRLRQELVAMRATLSWRLTAPLRGLRGGMRRALRPGQVEPAARAS